MNQHRPPAYLIQVWPCSCVWSGGYMYQEGNSLKGSGVSGDEIKYKETGLARLVSSRQTPASQQSSSQHNTPSSSPLLSCLLKTETHTVIPPPPFTMKFATTTQITLSLALFLGNGIWCVSLPPWFLTFNV